MLEVDWPASWKANVIIINDDSNDSTGDIAEGLSRQHECISLLAHESNRGKGAAVRTGFKSALEIAQEGDLIVIQDADLEYHPSDLIEAIKRFNGDSIDALVGDRFELWTKPSKMGTFHMLVNRFLTMASNRMTGLSLADMECCYKVLRVEMAREILSSLDEDRFGIEPQIAATLSRKKARVGNMPVSYDPRTTEEGKKIGFTDGVRALYVIVREWMK
jgi:glycosyltransferase involved in cell wall biosynthesis